MFSHSFAYSLRSSSVFFWTSNRVLEERWWKIFLRSKAVWHYGSRFQRGHEFEMSCEVCHLSSPVMNEFRSFSEWQPNVARLKNLLDNGRDLNPRPSGPSWLKHRTSKPKVLEQILLLGRYSVSFKIIHIFYASSPIHTTSIPVFFH